MKRTPVIVAVAVAIVILGFVAGRMTVRRIDQSTAAGRRVLYYVDPMHPAYRSDKPGIAPDCGMALVPVYEGETTSPGASLPNGSVALSPERQKLIGIRIATVTRSSGSRIVRTTGRIAADDNHLYKMVAGIDGWVESLESNPPGTLVKKNQKLATLYGLDIRIAETNYLGYLSGVERLKATMQQKDQAMIEDSSQVNEEQLRLLGMGDAQLKLLRETHHATSNLDLVAPGDGIVLSRGISPKQRFEKGTELYRIADLGKVWITADIHGEDGQPKPGTRVKVTIPELGKTIQATVTPSTPLFDEASRTLKLRLEASNPGFLMRPDMFVDVEFESKVPAGLPIPAGAVLDSGLRKIVYVETSEGIFEPRPVEIAATYGDQVTVAGGIKEGDRIVVSGNFLLDSESRMRSASSAAPAAQNAPRAGGMPPQTRATAAPGEMLDPVCGMPLKPGEVKFTETYQGKKYYLCSDSCRDKFLANPAKFAGENAASATMTKDPAAQNHD